LDEFFFDRALDDLAISVHYRPTDQSLHTFLALIITNNAHPTDESKIHLLYRSRKHPNRHNPHNFSNPHNPNFRSPLYMDDARSTPRMVTIGMEAKAKR